MDFNFGPDPSQAPALNWGIVAPGGIARKFADNVTRYTASQVVAVGSRSLERAQEFAANFDIPAAYGSYEEVFADPNVQAVYVASPHSHHYEQAIGAIEAGKHVLVEKSFTQYAWQAEEIFTAARARGLTVMEAMWTRHLPHMYAIRQLIGDGVLGEVIYLTAHHGQAISHIPRMARADLAGGALLDLGIYPIAFAQDILGVPTRVEATGDLLDGVDATVALTFHYPDGPSKSHGADLISASGASSRPAYAQISTTMMARMNNVAQIAGTGGQISIAGSFYGQSVASVSTVAGDQFEIAAPFNPPAPAKAGGGVIGSGFEYQVAEMGRLVAAGQVESPLRSWADTLASIQIIDAARHALGQRFPGEK